MLVLVQVLLALAVAATLLIANRLTGRESAQVEQSHQIQQGVYELFLTTRGYLAHGEEALAQQWEARFDSLRSLVQATLAYSDLEREDLEILSDSTRQMEELFHQMVAAIGQRAGTAADEGALRDAIERLATRLIGRGQVMADQASQLAFESTTELDRVRMLTSTMVFVAILIVLVIFGLMHFVLERDIVSDVDSIRRGTEIVAGGDLAHRVGELRTEELNGLARAFNAMTERRQVVVREREALIARLEQSNRELESFAFVASHDLQEPLRKIQTFGDLLEQRGADHLDHAGRDYLARMVSAASRMQALINALLQYSRIATRTEPPVEVALGALVRDVLSDLSIQLAESGGSVEVDELPTIVGGPIQMRQLFQNLLSNALKYRGDQPPRIRVWAVCDRPGPGIEVRVEDNGIGFDETNLPRLFKPFSRLQGLGEYEGTGMGLAICRRIAERHGGSITATSAPGKGSTFIVKLPREVIA